MAIATYCIYAADYSASTYNDEYYNTNAFKTIEYFKKDVKEIMEKEKLNDMEIVYLQWGNDCKHVDEKTIADTYISKSGKSGDTKPQEIIRWIKSNVNLKTSKIQLLYIITDGQIPSYSVQNCLQMNTDMDYENVVFHAYKYNGHSIDLSVAASFFKKQCAVIRNGEVLNQVNINESYDYDSINIKNFKKEKESLREYIKLKFIALAKTHYHSLQEIEKLKKLRNRLFQEFDFKKSNDISFENVFDKDKFIDNFIETDYYKTLQQTVYNDKVAIEKCISTLINYINTDKKSYEFDCLKYDTKYNAEVTEEITEDFENIQWSDEEKVEFPDIITFEESKNVPVILLATYNLPQHIIFHSGNSQPASFSKFKSVTECPLFLLNDKKFVDDSICYFYTVAVYQQLLNTEFTRDPYSCRDTAGGIILSQEFDKYNDYIVALNYFDSKSIKYNKGLFYYVLWKICDGKKWMDQNVVEKFKEYMLRRVTETKCYIGLTSLPLDPLIQTSLPAALWYCVEISSYIFKDDDEFYSKERLQNYHGIAAYMIEILTCLSYPLNLQLIKTRIDILKHLTILKRISKQERYYYMASKIFKLSDGFLISEIAHQDNVEKLNYIKLNHKEKINENVINEKIDLNEYVYFLDCAGLNVAHSICPETLRPHFVLTDGESKKNKSFYSSLLKNTRRVVIVEQPDKQIAIEYQTPEKIDFQRLLSLFNRYINCVKDNNRYPTLAEYREYVLKKEKYGPNDLPSIFPTNILVNIKEVYDLYQEAIKDTPVTEFLFKTQQSVSRFQRIKTESHHYLMTDEEIVEFIRQEEVFIKKTH